MGAWLYGRSAKQRIDRQFLLFYAIFGFGLLFIAVARNPLAGVAAGFVAQIGNGMLIPLMLAAGIDGLLLRVVWSKEFLLHDPEMFAVWCSLSIIAGCVTVVAFVLPVQWHPAMLAGSPIAMTMLLGRAIMHFHRRA